MTTIAEILHKTCSRTKKRPNYGDQAIPLFHKIMFHLLSIKDAQTFFLVDYWVTFVFDGIPTNISLLKNITERWRVRQHPVEWWGSSQRLWKHGCICSQSSRTRWHGLQSQLGSSRGGRGPHRQHTGEWSAWLVALKFIEKLVFF